MWWAGQPVRVTLPVKRKICYSAWSLCFMGVIFQICGGICIYSRHPYLCLLLLLTGRDVTAFILHSNSCPVCLWRAYRSAHEVRQASIPATSVLQAQRPKEHPRFLGIDQEPHQAPRLYQRNLPCPRTCSSIPPSLLLLWSTVRPVCLGHSLPNWSFMLWVGNYRETSPCCVTRVYYFFDWLDEYSSIWVGVKVSSIVKGLILFPKRSHRSIRRYSGV